MGTRTEKTHWQNSDEVYSSVSKSTKNNVLVAVIIQWGIRPTMKDICDFSLLMQLSCKPKIISNYKVFKKAVLPRCRRWIDLYIIVVNITLYFKLARIYSELERATLFSYGGHSQYPPTLVSIVLFNTWIKSLVQFYL